MQLSPEVENWRQQSGSFGTKSGAPYGMFYIPYKTVDLKVIICDGRNTGWDHVSVSLPNRCPNWPEMSFVKSHFWGPEETVIQFHPKESEYVNNHPYCLHLWKRVGEDFELPPAILVGFK